MSKHNFALRLDDEMHNWLKKEAQAQDRTVSNLIGYILTLYKRDQNGIEPSETSFRELSSSE